MEKLPNNRGTVLIVDDESVICELLGNAFQARGCTSLTAPNGKTALQICGMRHVDVVITDLCMPEKDGFELVRQLRSEFPTVKIIAISGMSHSEGFLKTALMLGAHLALAKPFTLPSIWSSIEALLGENPAVTPQMLPG
jgi:DNA-binding response OmpR family regulator